MVVSTLDCGFAVCFLHLLLNSPAEVVECSSRLLDFPGYRYEVFYITHKFFLPTGLEKNSKRGVLPFFFWVRGLRMTL